MAIKISPLDPLSDSQLSDAQYEKAMSLKAEKEAKASQKLAEQEEAAAAREKAKDEAMKKLWDGAKEQEQRNLALEMEAQREKQIAHIQQIAVRRIAQMGLAKGYTAWQTKYLEAKRRKNLIRSAGARLTKPAWIPCPRSPACPTGSRWPMTSPGTLLFSPQSTHPPAPAAIPQLLRPVSPSRLPLRPSFLHAVV